MQCTKCGHEVPLGKGECTYCGAALPEVSSACANEASETKGKSLYSEKVGGQAVMITSEEKVYESLEDVPVHLRKKVEEEMKQGGEKVFAQDQRYTHTTPEFEADTHPAAKRDMDFTPPVWNIRRRGFMAILPGEKQTENSYESSHSPPHLLCFGCFYGIYRIAAKLIFRLCKAASLIFKTIGKNNERKKLEECLIASGKNFTFT